MPKKQRRGKAATYGLCGTLLLLACDGSGTGEMMVDPVPEKPFEPVSAATYTAKVKNLLTGQAPTSAELMATTADPKALAGLIDQWMMTPEYDAKMLEYFKLAFQQTQITKDSLTDMLGEGIQGDGSIAKLMKSVQESYPRTVLEQIKQGKPFTDVVTSNQYMLNPPLMALMAFHDQNVYNDRNQRTSRIATENPNFTFSWTNTVIPLAQTLDPANANFMKWTNPKPFTNATPAGCNANPVVAPKGVNSTLYAFNFIFGQLRGCGATISQFSNADFDAWRMVTVRTPNAGEKPTNFYDLTKLRDSANSQLVLSAPKLGFYSTPAFYANWPTNASNQHRVTANQVLIVALGKSFDDTLSNNFASVDVGVAASDAAHADPTTPCWSCHVSLDPMRQFFRKAYSFTYHLQTDPAQQGVTSYFKFDGIEKPGDTLADLSNGLITHPRFASGWVNKLCYYANSVGCSEDDPEFIRVVEAWKASNYNWKTLVHELFSSPLVTLAARTKTFTDNEQPISISRREHLCTALSNRLGLNDVCGISAITPTGVQSAIGTLALSVPNSSYSRGGEAPITSKDPNLFFRSSTENICRTIGDQVIDAGAMPRYSSTKPDAAIDDFVATVMAIPSADPRYAAARAILAEHFAAAKGTAGIVAKDALKSTFVLACSSPTSVALGL